MSADIGYGGPLLQGGVNVPQEGQVRPSTQEDPYASRSGVSYSDIGKQWALGDDGTVKNQAITQTQGQSYNGGPKFNTAWQDKGKLWTGGDFFNADTFNRVANHYAGSYNPGAGGVNPQLNVGDLPADVKKALGLTDADNGKGVSFTDYTKPGWGMQVADKGTWAKSYGPMIAAFLSAGLAGYLAPAAAAAGAGEAAGAGAVGTGGLVTTSDAAAAAAGAGAGAGAGGIGAGLDLSLLPTLGADALPNTAVGAGIGESAIPASTTGGFSIGTPTSLGEAINSVGATDAITGGETASALTNSGGGLNGLVSSGLGTGSSGYGAIDAVAGSGQPSLGSSSLIDDAKKAYDTYSKGKKIVNTVKALTSGGKSSAGVASGSSGSSVPSGSGGSSPGVSFAPTQINPDTGGSWRDYLPDQTSQLPKNGFGLTDFGLGNYFQGS